MAISNSPQNIPPLSLGTPAHEGGAPPRKRGWLWFLIVVLLAGGGTYYYYNYMRAPSTSAAADVGGAPGGGRGGRGGGRGGRFGGFGGGPIPVAVTSALQQDVPYYLSCLGTVTAFNTVTVKTRVDGQLQKIYFQEGQFVHADDVLAEIDPRPYQVALAQMQGQLARDQSSLDEAKNELGRYATLQKEGVIAQQQVDSQNGQVGTLEGAVRADQAQIDNQKLQLVYAKVTAPISGRIGLRLVDQGNMVHASDQNGLVVITQVQPISTVFTVPEDNLQDVIKHMNDGQLTVVAYSRDDQTKLATGKLATVDNQIDPTTGTVKLKAVFDNENLALWPNQFVNIRLMLDVRKNAIVIPAAAVQTGAAGPYVYTVSNGNTAELRNVKVDVTQGNVTLIASGVVPGDRVVVDGQDKLQAGVSVVPHATGDNSNAAGAADNPGGPGGNRGEGPRGGFRGGNGGGPRGGNRGGGGPADSTGDPQHPGRGLGKRGPKSGPTT